MFLTTDEIAEQFRDSFAGSELVCAAPVALPVFLVTADLLVGTKRAIPSVTEFILRSQSQGLLREGEIAEFLGLDPHFVSSVVTQMVDDDFVHVDNDANLQLLGRGETVLRELSTWVAEERSFGFVFDAILRRPIQLRGADLVGLRDVRESSTIVVRGIPDYRPTIAEIRLADLKRVIQLEDSNLHDDNFELLMIKRVARATRRYRMATGLLFRSRASRDLQVALVSQGDRLREIESMLVENGALHKQHLVPASTDPALASRLKDFVSRRIKIPRDISDIDSLQQRVAAARLGLNLALGNQKANPGADSDNRVAVARDRLLRAQQERDAIGVRAVAAYEPMQQLWRAIESARSRLVISTTNLDDDIVNQAFVDGLAAAVRKGVEIRIVATAVPRIVRQTQAGWRAPALVESLVRDSRGHVQLLEGERSEFFSLLCDDAFAVVANQPFLGFRDERRSFRPVAGLIIHDPSKINDLRTSVLTSAKPIGYTTTEKAPRGHGHGAKASGTLSRKSRRATPKD